MGSPSRPGKGLLRGQGVIKGEGNSEMGLGNRTIWGRAPNLKPQLAKSVRIFSETVPSYT